MLEITLKLIKPENHIFKFAKLHFLSKEKKIKNSSLKGNCNKNKFSYGNHNRLFYILFLGLEFLRFSFSIDFVTINLMQDPKILV